MPCMYNGMPVKGNKGSCPMNSTWVEPSGDNKYAEGGNFFRNRYVTEGGNIDYGKAALDSTGLLGVYGVGRMLLGKSLMKGGKYLGDKLFRTNISKKKMAEQIKNNQFKGTTLDTNKFGLPNSSSRTIPGRPATQSPMINPATGKPFDLPPIPARTINTPNPNVLAPFGGAQAGKKGLQQLMDGMGNTRRLSPLKIGGAAALGTAGYDQIGPGLSDASRELRANQASSAQAQQQSLIDANTQALAQQNASQAATKAEADRVASLNPMERMMENLKNPGFLNESMSGAKGDTRLNRLGQLMSYYGSTPKQRANMKDPMDRFAAIEKGVMDNNAALAKAQATLMGKSPFGALGTAGLSKGLVSLVKERYDSFFGGLDDDEATGVADRVASVMQQMAELNPLAVQQPGGMDKLREEAFAQVEQELGL